MKRLLPPSALAATLLAGALLATSAGGAVAGALITSAQIKDGTITSADIRNKTIKTADISAAARAALEGPAGPAGPAGDGSITGYQIVIAESASIAAGAEGTVQATCPAGKKALGAGSYWLNTYTAPQLFPVNAGSSHVTWLAGGPNTSGTADKIKLSLVCANAS